MNSIYPLRALTVRKLRQVHNHPRREATEKWAIRKIGGETKPANLQTADFLNRHQGYANFSYSVDGTVQVRRW